MKIQFVSDLHLEFGGSPLRRHQVVGDVLVLAGDIAASPRHLVERLQHFVPPGIPVIYILGNHEFFRQYWDKAVEEYREALAPLRNVHFLEQESIILDGIQFLGCTLWTDFFSGAHGPASEMKLPDFHNILKSPSDQKYINIEITWPDVAKRFGDSIEWLRSELARPYDGPTVVITHHAPSALSNPPQFAGSPISGAFYSNLDDLIEETQPVLWIHGHMHNTSDYLIGKTRIVCNPFGYEGIEVNVDWDSEAMVEV